MNIEQKIREIIQEYNLAAEEDGDSHRYADIVHWSYEKVDELTIEKLKQSENEPIIRRANELIRKACPIVCLTSSSSYVREFKRWTMKNEKEVINDKT